MILLFFKDSYAAAKEVSADAIYGVIATVIGMNGVPEAIVAAVIVTFLGKILFRFVKS